MGDYFQDIVHEFKLPFENPVLVFSLILLIILLSPIIFRRLKVPGIVVLIISGIVIGPFGLGILEKNAAIVLFSKIGLLYIMFIAGLDLDINQFKANRHKSYMFGFLTFILPLTIGFPVCYYVLAYNFNASLLTASMFATHTLLAYPIVSKLGISKNEAVAITVGGTILTDTTVLILLAVIMGNAQGGLTLFFWAKLLISLIVFGGIMFLLVPKIAKWFFTNMEKEKHSHYIFVLTVVFLAAFLAELAGVEDIIGAFLAGLALNRLIPHTSALMNRIEFMGNSLFIPFFLISVGMLVDIRLIFSGYSALFIALCLCVVAVTGKWLAAFATQRIFHYSSLQRKLIFGLSTGHAAATLAVILVGYNAGIIDVNILNGTIILVLITSIIASITTENAANKLINLPDTLNNEFPEKLSSFKEESILLPLANIQNFDRLLEFAILIKDKASHLPISILYVVPNDEQAELNIASGRQKLEEYVTIGNSTETKVDITSIINTNIATGIALKSKELLADMLILGWPSLQHQSGNTEDEKINSIIKRTNKTVLICDAVKPWSTHSRLLIKVATEAENDTGFELWIKKMQKLSRELSVPVVMVCNSLVKEAVKSKLRALNLSAEISFIVNTSNSDKTYYDELNPEDLVMLVISRNSTLNYHLDLKQIYQELQNSRSRGTKIVAYT
ncbi:cation:proton antiporter [Gillisia sp. M10.2A]|uniref:Cation:proton antiporter n=1 Tax=Gillisia lutea TaxID=2909668 RepID=A0ABS9EFQ7_9FLAO|nr:cation:proton antiporter [Gillisia lutea]MCF4100620.1 cation:proton antiporter [Gillisia lutea]